MDKNKVIGIALILSGAMSLLGALLCKNLLPPPNGTLATYLLGFVGLLEVVLGVVFGFPRKE
ncbi:MAG: hypothetical protein K1Y36_11805 [Blastocatellia bacterium]|nr:hypothetical protein [Blastocatellia bacterium]